MHVTWINLRGALLSAAVWLAGAALTAHAESATDIARLPQAPLSTDNPFAKKHRSAPTRGSIASAIDSGAPVIYRLPNVSLFVPVPGDVPTSSRPWTMLLPPADAHGEPLSTVPKPLRDAKQSDRLPNEDSHRNLKQTHLPEQFPTCDPVPAVQQSDERRERSLLENEGFETTQPFPLGHQADLRIGTGQSASPQPAKPDALPFEPPQQVETPRLQATNELTLQLLPAVQRGYGLAQRGALFAAQTEFVQVLRRIAQAKDATAGRGDHSRALAAGLRALDEADDFVPAGIQLEADIDVQIVASSHRTPVLRDTTEEVLPQQAAALYHRYAEEQLAQAVAGEQAGSMALHGMGKIYALLAARNDDDLQLTQRAVTMYSAALAARGDNHLAANELGVLLCRSGRPEDAVQLFARTIDAAPSALAYHNLAVAQRKLGLVGQADANEQESQRLAARERATGAVSRREGVTWVSSEEMVRVAQPAPLTPAVSSAAQPSPARNVAVPVPPSKSPWQRTVDFARNLSRAGAGSNEQTHSQSTESRVARPYAVPTVPNRPGWR